MVFKQLNRVFQSLFLVFFLSVSLLFGVGHNLAMAAPLIGPGAIAQVVAPSVSDASLDLKAAVDRTLTAIPAGFYKVDDVAGLKRLQANSKALLVDVREPAEYQAGHIPEAINIPLRSLAQHLEQIDRDRPVVLYCSSGYRSAMGVVTLHLLGYDNVQGFPPSFAAWKAAGEAIAKG
jgi:rhodanese-related sulfurtransferase